MTDTPLKTVMIIEDDHDTRVSLRQSLEAEGYFVFSAGNGKQGLEVLRRIKPPCLILVDVVMPVMDGEEFMKMINQDPILHVIPVVLVSAYPERAKTIIAKAFVTKPVNLKTLLKAVEDNCL